MTGAHPFPLSPLRASLGKEAFRVTLAADRLYFARLINRSVSISVLKKLFNMSFQVGGQIAFIVFLSGEFKNSHIFLFYL